MTYKKPQYIQHLLSRKASSVISYWTNFEDQESVIQNAMIIP